MNSKKSRSKADFKMSPKEIKAYYEKARREFTIEDLKKFEEEADEVSFAGLVEEMDQMVQASKAISDSKQGNPC
jgi:hypothetical protein